MSTNKNKLSPEEQALRDKLNEADFHFQEADWKAIENEVSAGKWAKYKTLLKTAAAFVALSGAIYFLNQELQPKTEEAATQQIQKVEKKIPAKGQEVQKSDISPSKELNKTKTIEAASSENKTVNVTKEESKVPSIEANEVNEDNDLLIPERIDNESIDLGMTEEDNPPSNDIVYTLTVEGKYCLGEEIGLLAKRNGKLIDESKFNFRWFINKKRLIQQEAQLKYSLDEAGAYHVVLKIKDENGELISTIEESFHVEALPEINFTYEDGSELFTDFTAEFKPLPKNLSYQWFIDDREISLDKSNTYNFQTKGVYSMRMVYKNEAGCATKVEKPVAIMEDFGPFANAFSPNGDGINQEFMPHGFENHKGYFHFTVVDLSGKVVYESNSPLQPWNGKLNNTGIALPEGQYIWKLDVMNENGNKRSFTDRVKLLYLK